MCEVEHYIQLSATKTLNISESMAAILRSIRRRDVVSEPFYVYKSVKSLAGNGSSYIGQNYASLHRTFGSTPVVNAIKEEREQSKATETTIVGAQLKTKSFRPLSPHLTVYQPKMNSMLSIFNRISGVYLTGVTSAGYLLYLKMGMICLTYPSFYQVLYHTQQQLPVITSVTALAAIYHTIKSTHSLLTRVPKVQAVAMGAALQGDGDGIPTKKSQNKIRYFLRKLWEWICSNALVKEFYQKSCVMVVDSLYVWIGWIAVRFMEDTHVFGIKTKQCNDLALEVKALRKEVDELKRGLWQKIKAMFKTE